MSWINIKYIFNKTRILKKTEKSQRRIAMTDHNLKILQRLEAGEITAEDALAMMGQQKPPTPQPAGHSPTTREGQYDSRQADPRKQQQTHEHYGYETNEHYDSGNPEWLDSLLGWVGETVDDIAGSIKDSEVSVNISDIFNGTYGHHKRTEHFTSQPVLQGLTQLDLNGKNDKIEIYAYDGDCVQIRCDYDARRPDYFVDFHEENGHVSLWFDDKTMRSVRIICHVPRVHIGHINAVTKNARIHVADITAGNINLSTKNDVILLESISCGGLTAITRNENIKAMTISAEDIYLETTNAKITAENIRAANLTLKTTNAGIKTAYIDAGHLVMKTTNTRLKLEETLLSASALWEGERTLEAYTTNSGIRLRVPGGIGLNIEANTTDGKVTSDLPLYRLEDSRKNRLVGESMDYAMAGRKLKVMLGTTNASVKILAM